MSEHTSKRKLTAAQQAVVERMREYGGFIYMDRRNHFYWTGKLELDSVKVTSVTVYGMVRNRILIEGDKGYVLAPEYAAAPTDSAPDVTPEEYYAAVEDGIAQAFWSEALDAPAPQPAFSVGQRVVVSSQTAGYWYGGTGTVTEIRNDATLEYCVKFDDTRYNVNWFDADELRALDAPAERDDAAAALEVVHDRHILLELGSGSIAMFIRDASAVSRINGGAYVHFVLNGVHMCITQDTRWTDAERDYLARLAVGGTWTVLSPENFEAVVRSWEMGAVPAVDDVPADAGAR